MSTKPPIALLGLGLMGTGMAGRLLGQGFPVTVYNRTPRKSVPAGAVAASTPRQAASGANFIVSMLADDIAARGVWLGGDGALSGASGGAVLIECSTVTVDWVRELSAGARERGCELLDAPVTGSKGAAASGELTFLVGGPVEALDAARPVLAAMSKEIIHIGPSGSGAMMKLINNFVCGVQAVALAEAMAVIERHGMDRDKAVGVLTGGAPGSPLVKLLSARMMAKDYTPNFLMKLMAKDLRYAQQQCGSAAGMDVVAAASRTFKKAIEAGFGEKDFSAVVELARNTGKDKA